VYYEEDRVPFDEPDEEIQPNKPNVGNKEKKQKQLSK
jgi:hypothetical protein